MYRRESYQNLMMHYVQPKLFIKGFTFRRGESNHLENNKPHWQSIQQEGEH